MYHDRHRGQKYHDNEIEEYLLLVILFLCDEMF